MRKKLCLLVMCMAVSFAIAGCGNSSSDKSDTKTSEEGKNEKTSSKSQEEDIHVKALNMVMPLENFLMRQTGGISKPKRDRISWNLQDIVHTKNPG